MYHGEDEKLYPFLLDKVSFPEDFPEPYKCFKCARGRVCACNLKNIACCIFWKCGSSEQCQNPNWCNQQTFVSLYLLQILCLPTFLYLLIELSLYTQGCIDDLTFTWRVIKKVSTLKGQKKIASLVSSRSRKIFCSIYLFIGKIPHFAILSPTIAFM